uniref:Uncharacterized protein n=1 Tax=Physcomitrium patens TaxID=3218 RepID=A0A7I4EYJ4_PHYPA
MDRSSQSLSEFASLFLNILRTCQLHTPSPVSFRGFGRVPLRRSQFDVPYVSHFVWFLVNMCSEITRGIFCACWSEGAIFVATLLINHRFGQRIDLVLEDHFIPWIRD